MKIRDKISKEFGLLCFSKDEWFDPLLWGHYADKHRGIALGFEIKDYQILKVDYNETKLKLKWTGNITKDKEIFLYKVAKRKYINWKYENEYRIWIELKDCTLINGNKFIPFGEKLILREIILGSKFNFENDTSLEYLLYLCNKLKLKILTKSREERKSYRIVGQWTKNPLIEI